MFSHLVVNSHDSSNHSFQDAPGGYVNFGRTLPGWDKYCLNKDFGQRPWLFNNFDQLEFYEVTEDELDKIYARFKAGRFDFDISPAAFDVEAYSRFCESVAAETQTFKAKQQLATEREIERENKLLAQWQKEQKGEKDEVQGLDDIGELFTYIFGIDETEVLTKDPRRFSQSAG